MNPFDNYSTIFATPSPAQDAFSIERLKEMVADLAASVPQEWMLISPTGVMTKGLNPMKLAAMSMPRNVLGYLPFPGPNLDIQP